MIWDLLSEDDKALLREFADKGNGEALYETVGADGAPMRPASEYLDVLRRSAEAGHPPAAEDLSYYYENGGSVYAPGNEEPCYTVAPNPTLAAKYAAMAEALDAARARKNSHRVLVCDFWGWALFRCGETIFSASYIWPGFPVRMLDGCIERLKKGVLFAQDFSDEDHRYSIVETQENGRLRLFVRWEDDEHVARQVENPDYEVSSFVSQIVSDIEDNYFGWANFWREGCHLRESLETLKTKVDELKVLLKEA